ncbi:MAG: phosphopantothenoylcysteine decarboxylase [Phycisphaerales bacterium]|nr:phosphopantothenoylcysteine decarboxylase [Phycisphaerales bacterium]
MRILITAGPTREYFDTVRFISNPSSGKMGYAIAREAARRGHEVTLVSGPVAIKPPPGVKVIPVTTAAEMARACKREYKSTDAAVMAAAVCDYRPAEPAARKVPKTGRAVRIRLEPTEDIAAALGRRKGRRLLVGFALEDHDHYVHAERKLSRKHCDLIVLNGPENVGTKLATVEFYTPAVGWSGPVRGSKTVVARRLVRMIESLWASR